MADFNITNTSQVYPNTTDSFSDGRNFDSEYFREVIRVVTYVISSVGLLLTTIAIYSLYTMVRKDHVGPIYVINLLISDLIQLCCMIPLETGIDELMFLIVFHIYIGSLMVSIGFMVCIALERYLVIVCPLWYRFRHTKFSVERCVMIWVLAPVSLVLCTEIRFYTRIIFGTFFLLPLPLFIFFLGGTIRALSASRVPSDEKQRIVGILVLVLLIYTLLFLPAIIWFMANGDIRDQTLWSGLAFVFIKLSPLADLFLYVFMRKGTIDKLLASVCCCRMDSNDISRMESNDINRMDSNDINRMESNDITSSPV